MNRLVVVSIAAVVGCMYAVDGCTVSQYHVTLGDMFRVDRVNSHAFTLSSVFQECSEFPSYMLDCEGKSSHKIDNILVKQIKVDINGTSYNKKSLHAFVTSEESTKCQWSLKYQSKILAGPYSFPSRVLDSDRALSFAVVADMDLTQNSKDTVARLMELKEKDFDFLLHIGDFAYEIEDNGGKKGDDFFEQMSKITRHIPYIITPGNHENFGNGTLFNYRFRMPNSQNNPTSIRQNHLYDMLIKNVYFLSLNFDYILQLHPEEFENILALVTKKLSAIQNLTQVRWRIVYSHRPIMCNDPINVLDCSFNMYMLKAFDDIFIKYNVTTVLNAHLHIYSRFKPFHDLKLAQMDSVGRGTYLQIISGHSGTNHGFPDNSSTDQYKTPFVEKVDLSGATFMTIQVTDNYFEGQLRLSKTDSVLDEFSFNCPSGRKIPKWLFPLLVSLAAILFVVVFYFVTMYFRKSQIADEILRKELESRLLYENKEESVALVGNLEENINRERSKHGSDLHSDAGRPTNPLKARSLADDRRRVENKSRRLERRE